MDEKNKKSRDDKNSLDNLYQNGKNSDLYPTDDNISTVNAESSYFTPNGD